MAESFSALKISDNVFVQSYLSLVYISLRLASGQVICGKGLKKMRRAQNGIGKILIERFSRGQIRKVSKTKGREGRVN